METIFATTLGRVVELQKGHSDPLTEAAEKFFSGTQEHKKTSIPFLRTLFCEV
jgi:hypothetical protein